MEVKKFSKGTYLRDELRNLMVDESIEIPFKLFSEVTIRATASQLKRSSGCEFIVNARSEKRAVVTRIS